MKQSQQEMIKKYLETGKSLNPLDALHMFNCFRLSAIIFNLRKEGMVIWTNMKEKNGKRYANYAIAVQQEFKNMF